MIQQTVARDVRLEGRGLHTGEFARLVIRKAGPGSGIRFRRGGIESPAGAGFAAAGAARRTTVGEGAGAVETVEHLLAALYALGVTNAVAELDGPEVPALDGSSIGFVEALRAGGLEPQSEAARTIAVAEPIFLSAKNATLAAHPHRGLRVTYTLDYDYPGMRAQTVSFDVNEPTFAREIAPARTFCTADEAKRLREAGYGLGADTTNTLVMTPEGPAENALRFPDECARHKALDLIGDLALLGARLDAHVIAIRSGHALNRRLVEAILSAQTVSKERKTT